jgi:copper oxidase (laccase) domain-containing protein
MNTEFKKNASSRITVNADGLFTTLENVPLLNKSADANAITFESDKAIAILVGSWRCLGKDIMNLMLDHFKNHDIKFSDITVRIGPGFGWYKISKSYDY